MKYLLGLVLAMVSFGVSAQSHLAQSFLNVKSLHVSNTLAISNITMFVGMTNILGVRYTNYAGTGISVAAAGNVTKLLKDVMLWSDREGRVPIQQFQAVPGTQTNYLYVSPFTVSGRIFGASGANSAVTFVLTPFWNDHTIYGEGTTNEVRKTFNATTHDFTFAVTAVASSDVTFATNIVMPNWAGAKGVRVRSIVNGDTDASSGVYVHELDLTGFRP